MSSKSKTKAKTSTAKVSLFLLSFFILYLLEKLKVPGDSLSARKNNWQVEDGLQQEKWRFQWEEFAQRISVQFQTRFHFSCLSATAAGRASQDIDWENKKIKEHQKVNDKGEEEDGQEICEQGSWTWQRSWPRAHQIRLRCQRRLRRWLQRRGWRRRSKGVGKWKRKQWQ